MPTLPPIDEGMERSDAAGPASPADLPRIDRLGERSVGRDAGGLGVETFAVCAALSGRAEFCAGVAAARTAAERAGRGLSRLVGLHVPSGRDVGLLLLHQAWESGERLSEVAARRRQEGRPFTIAHVLFVLRETAVALRALHARGAGWCHGAVSPERLRVTTDARLVVCENVLGPGLAAVTLTPEWFAGELGIVVPGVPGVPLFTPLTDQLQLGRAILEVLDGHSPALAAGDLRDQLGAATVGGPEGAAGPLGGPIRRLLERMLLISPDGPYRSMAALERAIDEIVQANPQWLPAPPAVHPQDLPEPSRPARPPTGQVPAFVITSNTGEELDRGAQASAREALAPPLTSIQKRDTTPGLRLLTQPELAAKPAAPESAPVSPDANATSETTLTVQSGARSVPAGSATEATLAPVMSQSGAGRPRGMAEPMPRLVIEDGTFATPPARVPAPRYTVPAARRAPSRLRRWIIPVAAALCLAAAVAGAWVVLQQWRGAAAAPLGWLRLESKPSGATVVVNGEPKGQTPLTLSVPAADYRVEFALGAETRSITVPVTAHGEAFQLVSLYPPGPPGTIRVGSIPAGALVSLDGQARGSTPLELREVAPGEHLLRVESAIARADRTVEVLAGARVNLEVPLSGTIALDSPFEVTVADGSTTLGRMSRGVLAVGTGVRRLTFANATLNYEESREVQVEAGRATPVSLRPPNGVLNLEADTPAQVFLDGRPLGLTPLPNVAVSLGTHEVLFRDARGGEVRYVIVVALGPANRLKATLLQATPTPSRAGRRR